MRMDKRVSSSPPPRNVAMRMPAIPPAPPRPRFDDDEPTMAASSLRPVLSMSSRKIIVDGSAAGGTSHHLGEEPSRARIEEAPRSSKAVDANASGVLRDLSMTSSVSTDVSKMRRGPAWAMGFVAVGVLGGSSWPSRCAVRESRQRQPSSNPTHGATADVLRPVAAHVQAVAPGAAVQATQQQSDKPAAGSCNADAVAAAVVAKVEARDRDIHPAHNDAAPVIEHVEHHAAAHVVPEQVSIAPRPVVRHVESAPVVQPRTVEQPVAVAAPPPPPAKKGRQSDMESASAADALAKAQLDAALTR